MNTTQQTKTNTTNAVERRERLYESELNNIIKNHALWLKDATTGERADLSYKDLNEVIFRNIDLSLADISDSDMNDIIIINCKFNNTNFKKTELNGSFIKNSTFIDANFENSTLNECAIHSSDFVNANFKNANCHGANFNRCDLENTNLENAKIPIYSKLSFSLKNNSLSIDWKTATFEEWDWFFDDNNSDPSLFGINSIEFEQVRAMYEAYKAYYNTTESLIKQTNI